MTEARMNQIAAAFGTDEEKIREIAGKTLDEALEYFTAKGYDFTEQELTEFSEEAKKVMSSGELKESALEKVSGGSVLVLSCIAGALVLANAGIFAGAKSLDNASKRRYGQH